MQEFLGKTFFYVDHLVQQTNSAHACDWYITLLYEIKMYNIISNTTYTRWNDESFNRKPLFFFLNLSRVKFRQACNVRINYYVLFRLRSVRYFPLVFMVVGKRDILWRGRGELIFFLIADMWQNLLLDPIRLEDAQRKS